MTNPAPPSQHPDQDIDAPHEQTSLFDGDIGDAPAQARAVITYLTRNRILHGTNEPDLWEALLQHETVVVRHFHNQYVDLTIHRPTRVAFKQQITPTYAPFWVVVRAVTLTREASILALHLRERAAHAMPGETLLVTRTEAREQMEPFWPAHVANKAAKEKKLNAAIESLIQQDLLLRHGEDEWEISPAVPIVLTAPAIARFTDLLTAPDSNDGNTP